MIVGERVKLFRSGRHQAVRIPRGLELPGKEAVLRKEGNRLIVEAVPPQTLLGLLATLPPIEEDLEAVPDSPPESVDL